MTTNSLLELIEFAMEQEQEAVDFYVGLAAKAQDKHVRETLLEFAEQERGHKRRLDAVRKGGKIEVPSRAPIDLKISDYLVDIEPKPNLSFQDALIIAMKREKTAFRMYRDLARQCMEPELREVFLFLAHEEANHKLSFEVQYDEIILQEN